MQWKQIIINSIKTNYEVSNTGQVRNSIRKRELKGQEQQGYIHVTLSIEKKPQRFRVHRLVALMFIPNLDSTRNVVNHKNGKRNDNRVENLEWVTQQENTQHAWDTGLATSSKQIKVKQFDFDGNLIKIHNSITEAALSTNSLGSKITLCCQNKRVSHNNFYWKYDSDDIEDLVFDKGYIPPTLKKSVSQYDFNGELIAIYESSGKAAKAVNGTQSAVTRCCNGKANHHKGFIWKFTG